jgi:hypothetical protein
MDDKHLPNRLQHPVGILVAVMAWVIAASPLALAMAMRESTGPMQGRLLVGATFMWLVTVVSYRGLSAAHARSYRKQLQDELAVVRNARFETSELFQDRLNEQYAILDRIRDISHELLEEGIVDPNLALASINLVGSHAFEAQGLIEDAIAEVRIEVGSTTFNYEHLDVREEIEEIAAPFIRGGHAITTDGPQYFAETDAAVFRLVIRGFVAKAIEFAADNVDISLARDEDRVVCTVADDGLDRSPGHLSELSPVIRSLSLAVDGDLGYTRFMGRNQYSLSLPGCVAGPAGSTPDPIDVLGTQRPMSTVEEDETSPTPTGARFSPDDLVGFLEAHERDRAQSVAARRRSHAAAG